MFKSDLTKHNSLTQDYIFDDSTFWLKLRQDCGFIGIIL